MDITVVGPGAIGLVHVWMLAAAGHQVTILDARPDGHPGGSFLRLVKAQKLCFRFSEIDNVSRSIPEEGETREAFVARFADFPSVFIARLDQIMLATSASWLSQQACLQIIDTITRLPIDKVHIRLAQTTVEISRPQDLIVVTVKGAAMTRALGEKINSIPQASSTPVIFFVNGLQPWVVPKPNFGDIYLNSIAATYDCVRQIPAEATVDKVKAGVLIKYGAEVTGDGEVSVRSQFFNTKNVIANTTNTDETADLAQIARLYSEAGIHTSVAKPAQDIRVIMLGKLTYNLTGSMMAAIFGKKFGELTDNPATHKAVEDCACEFYQVASRLGVQLAPSEHAFVIMTVNALKDNFNVVSSPLQDIWLGRPTEKDCLIKAVIELAKIHDMDAPVLEAMYQLISEVEDASQRDVSHARLLQKRLVDQLYSEHGKIIPITQLALRPRPSIQAIDAQMVQPPASEDCAYKKSMADLDASRLLINAWLFKTIKRTSMRENLSVHESSLLKDTL